MCKAEKLYIVIYVKLEHFLVYQFVLTISQVADCFKNFFIREIILIVNKF